MFGNLLIIACKVGCLVCGTGQACGGKMEGGGGERGGYGHEMPSQLINTCVWLLEVREVTVTLVTSIKKGGNQGSY